MVPFPESLSNPKFPYKAQSFLEKPTGTFQRAELDESDDCAICSGPDESSIAAIIHFLEQPIPIPDAAAKLGKILPEGRLEQRMGKIRDLFVRITANHISSSIFYIWRVRFRVPSIHEYFSYITTPFRFFVKQQYHYRIFVYGFQGFLGIYALCILTHLSI